jgi:hypothetical protein
MKTWFTVSIRYTKQNDEGFLQRVTESYLFDAASYTEAESRASEEFVEKIKGEVQIVKITKAKLVDVIEYQDSDVWYKVKVLFSAYDADTERIRKTTSDVLVNAEGIKDAIKRTEAAFEDSISSFQIVGAQLSPVVGIYPFENEE